MLSGNMCWKARQDETLGKLKRWKEAWECDISPPQLQRSVKKKYRKTKAFHIELDLLLFLTSSFFLLQKLNLRLYNVSIKNNSCQEQDNICIKTYPECNKVNFSHEIGLNGSAVSTFRGNRRRIPSSGFLLQIQLILLLWNYANPMFDGIRNFDNAKGRRPAHFCIRRMRVLSFGSVAPLGSDPIASNLNNCNGISQFFLFTLHASNSPSFNSTLSAPAITLTRWEPNNPDCMNIFEDYSLV